MAGMDRRGAIGLMGAGALSAAAMPAAAARRNTLDVTSAEGKLRAYIMMRGALDEQLVISYIDGYYFGVVDAEITPLWDVVGVTFTRYRRRSDGGYDVFSGEVAHFFDSGTGKVPGEFHNPYTGKLIKDPRTNLPPTRYTILPDLKFRFDRLMPGMTVDHVVRAPEVRGDDIWFHDITRTSGSVPGAAKPFRYGESVTMHARLSDFKAGAKRVPTESNFTNFVDWRPWMQMDGHPGHLTAVGAGRFGVAMSELPERWTKATREKWPQVLENPAALLDPVYKSG